MRRNLLLREDSSFCVCKKYTSLYWKAVCVCADVQHVRTSYYWVTVKLLVTRINTGNNQTFLASRRHWEQTSVSFVRQVLSGWSVLYSESWQSCHETLTRTGTTKQTSLQPGRKPGVCHLVRPRSSRRGWEKVSPSIKPHLIFHLVPDLQAWWVVIVNFIQLHVRQL